ncbi:hypothetical protein [Pedobacter sp. SL55]|uniref:hypothetical protein n=1 Tax=Pedobacter sp. SL55 TaxID=2995161 RepID=UPI002270228C|nr:hypothetical protein [Pedobacter sp. SL55]WAC40665.1 hypothetical protein OVA16_19180 [Pedobacter sp. SL55]
MQELNDLETILLDGLAEKYPSLKSHLPHLRVTKRQISGFSLYVYFSYVDFSEEPEMVNALFSNGEKIEIPSLKDGLSYVIDVTAGLIEHLEFSTYKENWDGTFGDYKIVESETNI